MYTDDEIREMIIQRRIAEKNRKMNEKVEEWSKVCGIMWGLWLAVVIAIYTVF